MRKMIAIAGVALLLAGCALVLTAVILSQLLSIRRP